MKQNSEGSTSLYVDIMKHHDTIPKFITIKSSVVIMKHHDTDS
jgi:hypothetical protein